MSWINRVRNALPFIAKKEQSAENLWHKCSGCQQMIFTREWEENLSVCPKCDHHGRIGPKERFEQILDQGSCTILATPKVKEDPLKFRDTKKYTDRIKQARGATGDQDALINASGKIDGAAIVMGVQNFAYMGGSMGVAVGAAFVQGVEEAIKRNLPLTCGIGSPQIDRNSIEDLEATRISIREDARSFVKSIKRVCETVDLPEDNHVGAPWPSHIYFEDINGQSHFELVEIILDEVYKSKPINRPASSHED